MSAIWGKHTFCNTDNINTNTTDHIMRMPYDTKCRIDKITTLTHNNTYMGCGLQYITDISHKETLPLFDSDSNIMITADCILDNRKDLITLLSADIDTPDGLLILLSYKKWGIDCLKHFRGIFGFALYDTARQTLYLATDHTSSRCLYYYRKENEVYFSTLLEPIIASCPEIRHNQSYLLDYCLAPGLIPNITPSETPYDKVYKVCPGCYISISPDSVKETAYWMPSDDSKYYSGLHSAKDYGKAFLNLFEECVASASRTFKKTGISLSSGLDSSSTAAIAARQLSKCNQSLLSYTYVPYEKNLTKPYSNFILDETDDIQKILELYPNIEPRYLNNKGKNCLDDMEHYLSIMEIPYKAFVNMPNLCEIYDKAYKDGCGIVLTGQCGNSTISYGQIEDILYDYYVNHRYYSYVSTLFKYAGLSNQSRKKALKGSFAYFKKVRKKYKDDSFCYEVTNPFINKSFPDSYNFSERFTNNLITSNESLPVEQKLYQKHLYNKTMYSYLGELDTKLGLAHGIVIRDPSRDSRMISFCYNMPYKYFSHDGMPRWLIRGNFGNLLPHSLLYNLTRYGLQNADWINRLDRDWKEIYQKFSDTFNNTDTHNLPINTKMVREYLQKSKPTPINMPETDTQNIIFIYNLLLFIGKENKDF